ncbi:methylated-DNA--[protein]-cysteine S-methyltransferase [Tumebacillus permanentifrigoris]|uniref:Methylated-DNA--protein-cysteine methyltransferase n=1 Tax=Tumebacillus permanentifrigoris TaxID=378543 RepID=A0A316DE57_9BACL|nr:methylated-DNA--[protein]-cysteine S-methyltransferase [Tumebacillus permanentifrigoris]PWK15918.1 methylated-DNA-[protein]-cysteine S-methyltransferase [Tumebacillus permanentifrigoris]
MIVAWSKVQELYVAMTEQGVCSIMLPNQSFETLQTWVAKQVPGAVLVEDAQAVEEATRQLEEYFRGERRVFTLPLDMRGTEFQQAVWRTVAQIPAGETRSYSEIANQIGRPRAVRAVGAANGANPIPILIPCHRVIGSSGNLTGYRGGLPMKRELLDLEA